MTRDIGCDLASISLDLSMSRVRVLGVRVLGVRVLGVRVLGVRVLGVRVLGYIPTSHQYLSTSQCLKRLNPKRLNETVKLSLNLKRLNGKA
jgi:hypothetical protein